MNKRLLIWTAVFLLFSFSALAADKLIIPSGTEPVNIINSNFLVDQNITSLDPISRYWKVKNGDINEK